MKKHTKTYMDHFGYGVDDFIPCEFCGSRSVDIHHIYGRLGKYAHAIGNLMAVCRGHHNDCHDELIKKDDAMDIHQNFLKHGFVDPEKLGIHIPKNK